MEFRLMPGGVHQSGIDPDALLFLDSELSADRFFSETPFAPAASQTPKVSARKTIVLAVIGTCGSLRHLERRLFLITCTHKA